MNLRHTVALLAVSLAALAWEDAPGQDACTFDLKLQLAAQRNLAAPAKPSAGWLERRRAWAAQVQDPCVRAAYESALLGLERIAMSDRAAAALELEVQALARALPQPPQEK
jgi:hypothetical protein